MCFHPMVQKKVAMMTVPVILNIFITATISAFIFHDHHHRKLFVGSVRLVSSALYASPLVAMVSSLTTMMPILAFLHYIWLPNLAQASKLVYFAHIWKLVHAYITHTLNTVHIAEASNTDEKRGVYAILLVTFHIPNKFVLVGLCTAEPWSSSRGLWDNLRSILNIALQYKQ